MRLRFLRSRGKDLATHVSDDFVSEHVEAWALMQGGIEIAVGYAESSHVQALMKPREVEAMARWLCRVAGLQLPDK